MIGGDIKLRMMVRESHRGYFVRREAMVCVGPIGNRIHGEGYNITTLRFVSKLSKKK